MKIKLIDLNPDLDLELFKNLFIESENEENV